MRRPRAHREPVSPSRGQTEAANPTDSPWCLGQEPKTWHNALPSLAVAAAAIETRHDWLDGGTSGDRRAGGKETRRSLPGTLARVGRKRSRGGREISNPRVRFPVPRVWGLGLPILAEGLRGRAVAAGGVDGAGWLVAPGRSMKVWSFILNDGGFQNRDSKQDVAFTWAVFFWWRCQKPLPLSQGRSTLSAQAACR